MATTLVHRLWRPSTPETVDHDLAALWREVARQVRIARAVMSNLVVFRHRRLTSPGPPGAAETLATDELLEAIVARHPSRVVLIEHDYDHGSDCAAVAASVGIAVFGPSTARYAVEQVAVRSACAEESIPSIVRRLIRGDLPTSVWWTEDLSSRPPLQALVTMGRQLLYDSRRWHDIQAGVQALAPLVAGRRVNLSDLNWRRLVPLRLALVHAAASVGRAIAATDVRIVHRPGDRALACLFAGWLDSRLRWPGDSWPQIEEGTRGDETLSLTIVDAASTLTAVLDGHRVILRQPRSAPMVVGAPHEEEADALAGELRSVSTDTSLHDALDALARRFSSRG
jgi:glucose-6-phosphate dehydrogenase assembly protein OpcA